MRRRSFLLLLLLLLAATPVFAGERVKLTGKLEPDQVLRPGKLRVRLTSGDEYIAAILADERLVGKQMQAEGKWKLKDQQFDATQIYTVHDGKLHRITYFCDVCTVWASKPGPCICCLQPVELREIPVDEN